MEQQKAEFSRDVGLHTKEELALKLRNQPPENKAANEQTLVPEGKDTEKPSVDSIFDSISDFHTRGLYDQLRLKPKLPWDMPENSDWTNEEATKLAIMKFLKKTRKEIVAVRFPTSPFEIPGDLANCKLKAFPAKSSNNIKIFWDKFQNANGDYIAMYLRAFVASYRDVHDSAALKLKALPSLPLVKG